LANGGWANLRELLSSFKPDRFNVIVVKKLRDSLGFQGPETFNLVLLPLNVAFVLNGNFDLVNRGRIQVRLITRQIVIARRSSSEAMASRLAWNAR